MQNWAECCYWRFICSASLSFAAINRADIQDTDMEAIMDTIVDSLFCFFVTLGEYSPQQVRWSLSDEPSLPRDKAVCLQEHCSPSDAASFLGCLSV